jgi:hypothetical protein
MKRKIFSGAGLFVVPSMPLTRTGRFPPCDSHFVFIASVFDSLIRRELQKAEKIPG